MAFWVEGGEYENARFERLRGPAERLGPFVTYAAAEKTWKARTMATIDNALVRYRIIEEAPR